MTEDNNDSGWKDQPDSQIRMMRGRHPFTYRSHRREAAKGIRKMLRSRQTVGEHTARARIRDRELPYPLQPIVPAKVEGKVYRGGNVPGSVRRLRARQLAELLY